MIARKPRAAIRPRAGWAAPPLLLAGTLLAVHGLHAAGPASITNINPPPNGAPAIYDRGVTDPATGGQGTVRLRGHVSSADSSPVTSVQLHYYTGSVAPGNLVATRNVPVGDGSGVPAGPYQDVFDPAATGLYIVTAVPLNGMTDVGPGGENEIVRFEVRNDIAAGPVASFEIGRNGLPNVFLDAADFFTYTNNTNVRLQGTARADATHNITQIDAQNLDFASGTPAGFVQSVPFSVTKNTAGDYDFPWTLTAGPDGPRAVQVRFLDSAGHLSQFFKRGILLDTTAPTVTTVAPATGACFTNGNVAYSFGASDPGSTAVPPIGSGLDPASGQVTIISLDGQAVATPHPTITGNPSTGSFTAASSNLPTGAYRQFFTIRDFAGNLGSTQSDFRVDTNRPTATISSPAANQTRSGVIVATGSVADNATTRESGLASYTLSLTGQSGTPTAGKSYTFTQVVTGSSTQINVAIDTLAQNLPDGPYTLSLVATDQCGNTSATTAQTSLTIRVANNAPTVTITAPAEGACVNTQKPTITAQITRAENVPLLNGTNPANLTVQVNGKTISVTSTDSGPAGAGTRTLSIAPTNNMNLGNNSVVVEVRDNSNPPNVGTSDARTFVVDLAPPTATLTSPKAGSVVSGTIIVTGSLTDDVALKSGTLTLTATPKSGGTPTTFTVNASGTATNVAQPNDTTLFQDGTATLTLSAVDACNQVSVNNPSVTFTIDNTAPKLTGSTNSGFDKPNTLVPPDADTNQAGVQVAVDVPFTEPNLDTAKSQLFLDNTDITAQASFAGGHVTAAPTVGQGQHTFRVVLVDLAGHTSSTASSSFIVDQTKPVATFTNPKAGTVVSGNVNVSGTLTDNVALKSATLSLTSTSGTVLKDKNGTDITRIITVSGTAATFSETFDTVALGIPDGPVSAPVTATDVAGNTSDAVSVDFIVSNQGLSATIDHPTAEEVKNTICLTGDPKQLQISGTVSGAALDPTNTHVDIDGQVLPNSIFNFNAQPATFNVTLTVPNQLSEGTHTITVRAQDLSGRAATPVSRTFTVDANPPAANITFIAGIPVTAGNRSSFGPLPCKPSSISIQGTLTDAVALQSYQWLLDGAPLKDNAGKPVGPTAVSGVRADASGTLNLAGLKKETTHTLTLVATDACNQSTRDVVTFTLDNTAPTITALAASPVTQVAWETFRGTPGLGTRAGGPPPPIPSQFIEANAARGVVTISANAQDDVKLDRYDLKIVSADNSNTTTGGTGTLAGTTASVSFPWNTSQTDSHGTFLFPDGHYTVTLTVFDTCDNSTTNTIDVYVDHSAPTVTFLNSNGGTVKFFANTVTTIPIRVDDKSHPFDGVAGAANSDGTIPATAGPLNVDNILILVKDHTGKIKARFNRANLSPHKDKDGNVVQDEYDLQLLLSAKTFKKGTYTITVGGVQDPLGNTSASEGQEPIKVVFH